MNELYELYKKSAGICTDSRVIKPGELFFALETEANDGHRYVANALSAGAIGVVVHKDVLVKPADKKHVVTVNNTLRALQDLTRHHRKQFDIPVIGIAGSNGKTTTKDLVQSVLSQKYTVLATEKNYNNHIGVPLTLLRLTNEHEVAVVELGSNHLGEIAELLRVSMPTHGLVTSIGKEHLEGFGSMAGIIDEELAVYQYLMDEGGVLFINTGVRELRLFSRLKTLLKNFNRRERNYSSRYALEPYGSHSDGDRIVSVISSYPELALRIHDVALGEEFDITTNLYGAWNQDNVLTAYTVGRLFGLTPKQCQAGIKKYKPRTLRGEARVWKGRTLLLDCYNANPTSMEVVLADFAQQNIAHPVLLIGGMREMGSHEYREHRDLLKKIAKTGIKQVVLVGGEFAPFQKQIAAHDWQWFSNAAEAREANNKKALFAKNATVLVKGSRGIALETIFE